MIRIVWPAAAVAGALALGRVPASMAQSASPPAPGLFESEQLLALRLSTDLKALMDDRDSLKATTHAGTLSYVDASGQRLSIDVALKTRGHWRRQKRNCEFAPIKVDFPSKKEQPRRSLFRGEGDLKLVTHCRTKDAAFEQYVLREYLVYKLYNLLGPVSFRARLARTTYVDTAGKLDSVTRYSFLIEGDKRVAARHNGTLMETRGARFDDLDAEGAAVLSAFEYLIGGTDWSLVGLHNIVLVQSKENGGVIPVPYDFDWTGIVWTKYSFPDYRLPIKTVRERVYRGICRTPQEWAPVLRKFRDQRTVLYAVYGTLPDLDAKYVKDTREYLDDFYKVIDSPGLVKAELINNCKPA